MFHQCKYCVYKTPLKANLRRHIKNKHVNEAIGVDGGTVFVGNNQSNVAVGYDAASSSTGEDTPKVSSAMHVDMQHGLGTGGAQDKQTVSIEGYTNIINETYKWQDAYEDQKQVNIMKDNAIKIRDIHILKLNNKLLSETNKNKDNNEKVSAMGKDMGRIINKYEILKKKKLNKRDNKNDQRGYGMEDDSSEYGHGDTDEESVDDTEQNTGDEMDEDDGSEYGHGDTDEESVDDSEQSEDKTDNERNTRGPTSVTYGAPYYERNTRGPTSVTYGAPYYEIRTGAGIGGLLRARYRRGIGGLEV